MLIRHCLSRKAILVPRRSLILTPILHNVSESNATQTIPTPKESNKKQKRIYLKPDEIRNRKRKNNGKRKSSTSRSLPRDDAPKVDLALIQELYRKNNDLANPSTNDDLFRYIETFRPFEPKIGRRRYDQLTKEVNNAFKKNQIISYINYYTSKHPDSPPLIPRLSKHQLIESLFMRYWRITKQDSNASNDELLSYRVIELTPAQRFLLDPKRSKFIRNIIACNIKVQLGKNKLSVSGLKSDLDYIEAELVQLSNQIKTEEIDLSSIGKSGKTGFDFNEISMTSSAYFEQLNDNKFKILARSQQNIDTAKRLILWALDNNPHIQTLLFNKKAITNARLLPYVNEDVWAWCDKHAQYYSLFFRDRRPGAHSDLVFEKFDKMNDKFLKSKSLGELVDHKLALKSENDSFLDDELSQEVLNMFKSIGTAEKESTDNYSTEKESTEKESTEKEPTENEFNENESIENKSIENESIENKSRETQNITNENPVDANSDTVSQVVKEEEPLSGTKNEFDLDKIIKNRHESASTTNDHEQHLNLEELRHELGAFDHDLKLEDFPDVSNLIVDAEKQTSDEVLEILRAELGAFAEDDGGAGYDDTEDVTKALELVDDEQRSRDFNDGSTSGSRSDDKTSLRQSVKSSPLSKQQIDDLYTQLNDLAFANGLPGASRDVEPYSAYTIQFGSLLFKQDKGIQAAPTSEQLVKANKSQFSFLTSIPFIKDLATSLPILYNGNQTFTNKMQIRLVPSIYVKSDNSNLQQLQQYPPVEIQADLNDWGKIKLETLQVLSIEAINNCYVAMPHMASDLQVSKLIIGDLLQPQMESQIANGISFDNQPNLSKFLEDSQLSFGGKIQIKPSSSIELCINDQLIKYDFVHLTYKTDLMFDLNGRELCLSIVEGGSFGGKRFEVILGDGELSNDDFAKFLNDAIRFYSEI
ncbi:hypothetical protein K4G60_g2555 [Candida parapsilosis]|nr:hypothetical protein K4G60_g2555 [Candida parapsilosis]